MILSLVNVKGGVGKTTTAVNLGSAFASAGLRALVVDADPQGSATHSLGFENAGADTATLGDALLRDAAVADAIVPTAVENLSLVPASLELAGADLALARKQDPERRLAKALAPIKRRFDVIVVDSPPGLSLMSVMALHASHGYIVPVNPQRLAVDALERFFAGLEAAFPTNPPDLIGILLTMVDHRTKVTDELVAEVRGRYGRRVLNTEIPLNIRLAIASGEGQSIFEYESWSTGGVAYRRLGGEVLRRVRRRDLL
jgi:chromosome partitioning protein